MSGAVTPILRDAMNRLVDGKIGEYTIEVEENNMNGENYLGEIMFLSLNNKSRKESLRFVIKQSRESMKQIEKFKTIYVTEICFYKEIWPVLHKFQQRRSIGFDKIPKFYASISDEVDYIILEDLRQYEFRLYDKTRPLDDRHFDLIFRNYGVFHAISFAFREENPEEFRKLTKNLKSLDELVTFGNNRFEALFKAHLKAINELFDGKEHVGIKDALDKQLECTLEHFVPEKDESVTVLTHGDCWSNNLMFKYNEKNEPIDMRMMDFQIIGANSPVKDLSYTFYSGAPKDLLDKLDFYLRVYHGSFMDTLEKLGCNPARPVTLDRLKEQWRKHCRSGFYLGLILWGLKFVDKDHIPSFDDDEKRADEGREPKLFAIAPDMMGDYNRAVTGLAVHMYENGFI